MASKLNMPAPPFKVLGENTNISRAWDLYIRRFDYYLYSSAYLHESLIRLYFKYVSTFQYFPLIKIKVLIGFA